MSVSSEEDIANLALLRLGEPEIATLSTTESGRNVEAVDAFYYPPLGKRSWGPLNAYRIEEHGGMGYASWWNDNGVLAIQLETVEGIQRCRELVLPGVDMVMFGGNDLQFSLDATADAPWATCRTATPA